LQLPAGQAAGVAIGQSVQTDFGKQPAHLSAVSGGQPPHHVIRDSTAQHLTLRVLQDHRGSAEVAESDCPGTFHRARDRIAAREDQRDSLRLDRGRVRVALVGDGTELDVNGTVFLHDDRIDLRAKGDANLAVLQGFLGPNVKSSGRASLDATLLGSMNGFDVVQATTGGGPARTTEILNIFIYRTFGQGLFAQATAMSLVLDSAS